MARNNRTAFTLVELLVVIVIIGMLVALVVPAVISARESARRASCLNRMDQLGKAILQYEGNKGHLPGYVNEFGGGALGSTSVASNNNLSWVVLLFENIGRADLWKEWRAGNRVSVSLTETVCASDLDKRGKDGALSYVVNCGISDERTTDVPAYVGVHSTAYRESAWGLFFDHDTTTPNGLPGGATQVVKIGLDQIADGAQQTILLSENLNAGFWTSAKIDASGGSPVLQSNVGMVWWSTASGLPWVSAVPTQVEINSQTSNAGFAARPSSHHPGGVNAIMADGHAEFISERVEYTVFRDQMISNQTKAAPLIP